MAAAKWLELCEKWPLPDSGGKRQLRSSDKPHKVSKLQFGMFKPHEMQRLAHVRVVNRELYQQPSRAPQDYGPLDQRMGATSKTSLCKTCGLKLADCVGHFGVIELELPVFHIGYFKMVLTLLQCICKNCSRVLLYEQEAAKFREKMRGYDGTPLQQRALQKVIIDKCKRTTKCPHCGLAVGAVKKAGALKIVYERYRFKKDDGTSEFLSMLEGARALNEDLDKLVNVERGTHKVHDTITPLMALEYLSQMTNADCEMLSMRPDIGRPEEMILTRLLVPPVCIRPSVTAAMTSGSNEDDLTIKIGDIVQVNHVIKDALSKGTPIHNLMSLWDFLQLQVASYINSELPGVPAATRQNMKSRKYTGLCQRMKGKTGRFRGNLSGKRVDFSSRTVISPDPNMGINEVVVPQVLAKVLTYPEVVGPNNRDKLRRAIMIGPDGPNGANFVVLRSGPKKYLRYGDRKAVARELRDGDIVERHLEDGDVALFNRQPSLHKVSIMAHRVRVMPWRTFRFNVCVCSPYNADFDGDEMNLHVPQTEEARAEAAILMGVENNIVTPRSGSPLVAAIQDIITCTYLLTYKDMFMDKARFCQAVSFFADATERIVIPPPSILKPIELWTGKQVFDVLLNPAANYEGRASSEGLDIVVNMASKNKSYTNSRAEMCPADGFTVFRHSRLLAGVVDKSVVGSGSKTSLFYVIEHDHSPALAAKAMHRLAKFSARWLANFGFSIGISDVMPSRALTVGKAARINAAYARVDDLIALFKKGELDLQAGCSAEQTLENKITKVLSDVRKDCGDLCLAELKPTNSPLIMTMCGSKGSNINISQMVACVGQQTVSGSRIADGFLHRTLPMFDMDSRLPAAKGFCANSFYSGLDPTEFFFHTMGGREGLVDTAVKTADTGYMQRRLMKALEDLSVMYDGTVRNSVGSVIQFKYGDDSLDPSLMEGDSKPINFPRTYMASINRVAGSPSSLSSPALLPAQIRGVFDAYWAAPDPSGLSASGPRRAMVSDAFFAQLVAFLDDRIAELEAVRLSSTVNGVVDEQIASAIAGVTEVQLLAFLDELFFKYRRAEIEPGSAVGALGAQSIGEPGTQMTLKTFHFAGVASMNITLGVPRIREIINASKDISTPIIEAPLLNPEDLRSARIVKGRIEKTTLAEVALEIASVYGPHSMYVRIVLDLERITKLQLSVTVESVAKSIMGNTKLKLAANSFYTDSARGILRVYPTCRTSKDAPEKNETMSQALLKLKNAVGDIIVCGIPSVSRAVISEDNNQYKLMIDGIDLRAVMGVKGVDFGLVTSNHIIEVERTLGIEAARLTIMKQIDFTMSSHGMSVDQRHLMLLADLMSFRGEILGITRFGIGKMKNSTLMLASFEKTMDILFDAAVRHRVDAINGVSECIIMGVPMTVGSGSMKLNYDHKAAAETLGVAPSGPIREPLLLGAPATPAR